MRTTLFIASLALLGLVAVPSVSAMSSEAIRSPDLPCQPYPPGNTVDDTLNLVHGMYCMVRPFAQNELDNINEDINHVFGAIKPFIDAAKAICENHAGNRCDIIDAVGEAHIDPNVHEWEWQTLDANDAL